MAFDPNNKDHRRYYADFVAYGGWGRCPVRFIVPDETGMDIPTMIRNKLCEYYLTREFGGGIMAIERSRELSQEADKLYREAGKVRKEADALLKPRRT